MNKNVLESKLKGLKNKLGKATLVAVSKYSPIEDVELAFECGHRDFGENRLQDLIPKAQTFEDKKLKNVRWHFIGHLQSNKVKELLKVPQLFAIHSVDSIRLLEELLKRESELKNKKVQIFFQVNTSHEEEKSGFDSMNELSNAVELFLQHKDSAYEFAGLMTMGTIRTDHPKEEATRCFKELVVIRDELVKKYDLGNLKLSMGMSNDFEEALKLGADYIRVGSLIFK